MKALNPEKYISFNLWGNQPKYINGALANAELALEHFPGWRTVFFVSREVSKSTRGALEDSEALIIDCRDESIVPPCTWRYLIADQDKCERFISRDCDSRLNSRDRLLVAAWEASGKSCHFIQDHIGHKNTFMAGAWGCKPKFFNASFRGLLEKFCPRDNSYGIDQKFIKHVLWPKAQHDSLVATDFTTKNPYVGQVHDALNTPVDWVYPEWSTWVK